MIRSSKHTTGFANSNKQISLSLFIQEYQRIAQIYIDYIWLSPISYTIKDKTFVLDIQHDLLDCPIFLDYNLISFQTSLSARALSSCITQVCSLIRGALDYRKRMLWLKSRLVSENQDTIWVDTKLSIPLTKPILKNFKPELSSKCFDIESNKTSFDCFVRLKSLGSFEQIKIPIKHTKVSNKWKSKGKMLGSILVSNENIYLRFDIDKPEKKIKGVILGADPGVKTALTLSNGLTTIKDKDGHDLYSIQQKLSRRKKGSKGFKKAQDHRLNYINWSLNQLDFSNTKQLNLESNNLFKGAKHSRLTSHYTHSLIQGKVERLAEEEGFFLQLNNSTYRSQRCFECGLVCKSNRKGKEFCCKGCGVCLDADLNAAKNNEAELYKLPNDLRYLKLNIQGFYWNEEGIFDLDNQELRVPDAKKSYEH
jgi:transposase